MANINEAQIDNLVSLLDGYAAQGGHHLNVNVYFQGHSAGRSGPSREISPADCPGFRLRRKLNKLTKEQQDEVISRTFHTAI